LRLNAGVQRAANKYRAAWESSPQEMRTTVEAEAMPEQDIES